MTLIVGVRCRNGLVVAADRRRLARYEKGPEATKLYKLTCDVVLAGAGDDAVLNEARVFIDRKIEESQSQCSDLKLFDAVEITCAVVNDLVGYYKDKVEEPFGYVLAGLEGLSTGSAKLYTVFGAGLSEVPWVCLGSGSTYARPIVDLLLADEKLDTLDVVKVMPHIFSLVANVQTTVGGGVDICIVKDGEAPQEVQHFGDVDLKPLKATILNGLGIQT